jgi:hypothetical protein
VKVQKTPMLFFSFVRELLILCDFSPECHSHIPPWSSISNPT